MNQDDSLGQILIVDDQIFNIDALEAIIRSKLKGKPIMIDTAQNGLEAVDKVKDNVIRNQNYCSYKIIFMDCNMPHMDGYTASRKIRTYLKKKLNLDQDK